MLKTKNVIVALNNVLLKEETLTRITSQKNTLEVVQKEEDILRLNLFARSALFAAVRWWLAQQVGSESERTFHLVQTKTTLTPGQPADESQMQQMSLGAWQQLSPSPANAKSPANHSRDQNDRRVRRPTMLKNKMNKYKSQQFQVFL